MSLGLAALSLLAAAEAPARRGVAAWLADPRSAVLATLAGVLGIGGGRAWLRSRRARRAVEALANPDASPESVEAAADHGRAGLVDLFRILGSNESAARRDAAGRALAMLWKKDEMIVEEEQALVRRGFLATWSARRRYPSNLGSPFPVSVRFGVPFLGDDGPGVTARNLEWSWRILGSGRAGLETFSPWAAGPGLASFAVDPMDYDSNGPHRLALHARARSVGLTDSWQIDLPQIPFSFEFDPLLSLDALFAQHDDARAAVLDRAARLEPPGNPQDAPVFLDLNSEWALRDPPSLVVATPLPCDLAHAITLEFEGVPRPFAAGSLTLSGQGLATPAPASERSWPLTSPQSMPASTFDRPGLQRMRCVLTVDPNLGWADPEIRSVWPGTISTDWVDVRVVRR